ncbi:MAG: ribonuclease HI [Treponemataceae bacterium]|nr:ribonuclease HI [Spirochaetales bacterium]MDY6030817.1 ribonuclease HI [Treponemataceae bacterium]
MSKITIYTDGACSGNPGPGGWGCVILEGEPDNPSKEIEMSGGEKSTTNNRMELMAAIQSLSRVAQDSEMAVNEVTLITDSQYVKNGITQWIFNWKKNGWKTANKQPVKNQDLWIKLDELTHTLNIKWDWVKGHAGNKYNEICDTLATTAAKL